ncbi:MAG: hypothetical protein C4516_03180 [Oxalobacter sp.]|nr:MAG: hypothetical protein C4516_03180 [Oxalobacter sp.]
MPTANKHRKPEASAPCLCGKEKWAECCGRFLNSTHAPETSLELMRSRYAAYALQNERYLMQTWFSATRPTPPLFAENEPIKWLSLEILSHHEDEHDGVIEFVARYKVNGRAQKLHEISRFVREDGRWFYLDGRFPDSRSPDNKSLDKPKT